MLVADSAFDCALGKQKLICLKKAEKSGWNAWDVTETCLSDIYLSSCTLIMRSSVLWGILFPRDEKLHFVFCLSLLALQDFLILFSGLFCFVATGRGSFLKTILFFLIYSTYQRCMKRVASGKALGASFPVGVCETYPRCSN